MTEVSKELFNAEIVAVRHEIVEMRDAVKIANAAFEKRMESTNEWRKTLEGLQAAYVTKEQVRWTFMALIGGIAVATAIFAAINGVSP